MSTDDDREAMQRHHARARSASQTRHRDGAGKFKTPAQAPAIDKSAASKLLQNASTIRSKREPPPTIAPPFDDPEPALLEGPNVIEQLAGADPLFMGDEEDGDDG